MINKKNNIQKLKFKITNSSSFIYINNNWIEVELINFHDKYPNINLYSNELEFDVDVQMIDEYIASSDFNILFKDSLIRNNLSLLIKHTLYGIPKFYLNLNSLNLKFIETIIEDIPNKFIYSLKKGKYSITINNEQIYFYDNKIVTNEKYDDVRKISDDSNISIDNLNKLIIHLKNNKVDRTLFNKFFRMDKLNDLIK